jgi:hypothetical protein
VTLPLLLGYCIGLKHWWHLHREVHFSVVMPPVPLLVLLFFFLGFTRGVRVLGFDIFSVVCVKHRSTGHTVEICLPNYVGEVLGAAVIV